jgi:precorrin-6B methylase 2
MKEAVMTNETLTPDGILQLGWGFIGSKTLLSAVELGVFTELGRGPRTWEELAGQLGLHPRGARDFLDALVALGMLEREGAYYTNTPETDYFLDRSKPSYIGGSLEMGNTRLYPFWGALTEALRTGEPQNEAKHGESFFEALYHDPARLELFLAAMTGDSLPAAQAIARQFRWRDYRTFVDVGTAQGGLPVELVRAHPHLQGIGFDLPMVGLIFERYVAAAGLQDRLRFVAGDFFVDPLPQGDVLVMGRILHDWDLEQRRILLAKAYAALPEGGALIVYEALIDDDRRNNAIGLLESLNMLIETPGGSNFTAADCTGWMHDAGFRETRVEVLNIDASMIVGIK